MYSLGEVKSGRCTHSGWTIYCWWMVNALMVDVQDRIIEGRHTDGVWTTHWWRTRHQFWLDGPLMMDSVPIPRERNTIRKKHTKRYTRHQRLQSGLHSVDIHRGPIVHQRFRCTQSKVYSVHVESFHCRQFKVSLYLVEGFTVHSQKCALYILKAFTVDSLRFHCT